MDELVLAMLARAAVAGAVAAKPGAEILPAWLDEVADALAELSAEARGQTPPTFRDRHAADLALCEAVGREWQQAPEDLLRRLGEHREDMRQQTQG